jgi:arylsulfatase
MPHQICSSEKRETTKNNEAGAVVGYNHLSVTSLLGNRMFTPCTDGLDRGIAKYVAPDHPKQCWFCMQEESSNTTNKKRSRRRFAVGISLTLTTLCIYTATRQHVIDAHRQLVSAGTEKPNIMLLVLDQWRYDWDGMHPVTSTGQPIPLRMPFLSSVAERGTRFTQAYVPTPLCAPSRACLAAGKEYDATRVLDNRPNSFPLNQPTFYKLLRDHGNYHTMIAGKDDLYPQDPIFPYFPGATLPVEKYDLGFSDARRCVSKTRVTKETPPYDIYRTYLEALQIDNQKGIDVYRDCFHGKMSGSESLCQTDAFTDEIYTDEFIHNQALQVLAARQQNKPWFLQVNFAGPHPPNFVPTELAASVKDRIWPDPIDNGVPERWACPEFKNTPQYGGRCSYAAELERLDRYMASLADQVNTGNTIVCITGDHGEMLGDHNIGGKKVPLQPSISVPLVCMGAGIQRNYVATDPVATLDLVGTFLDVAGVAPDPAMTVQSLWPSMTTSSPLPRKAIHSGLADWRLVVKKIDNISYKLICCLHQCPKMPGPTPPPPPRSKWHVLLYNTQSDPDDMSSLHTSLPEIVTELIGELPDGWCRDYY